MQYSLCPRCQFRVPVNRHVCATCGHVLQTPAPAKAVNDKIGPTPEVHKSATFWQRFFGLPAGKEHKSEEPVLS